MHIKSYRTLLLLVLTLLLLTIATAPLQAYHKDTGDWSCYVQTYASCNGTVDTDEDGPYYGAPPLFAKCESEVDWRPNAHAWARGQQHVTEKKTHGKQEADAWAEEGYSADAWSYCEGDPVVSAGQTHGFALPYGIKLWVEHGSSAWASIELILWDDTAASVIWRGYAKFTPGHVDYDGTNWPEEWQVHRKVANYPAEDILKEVPAGNTFYTYCTVEVSVNGGGRAYARTFPRGGVGGIAFPVDKLALLAPYIALAVALVAVTAGAVYSKKRWLIPKS